MTPRSKLVVLMLLLLTGILTAQVVVQPRRPVTNRVTVLTIPTAPQVSPGAKGIPFSAETVTITEQVLADGNRIHQEKHGKTFRDSEGRTRYETEFARIIVAGQEIEQIHISIQDPVQHVLISLDPQTKTARVHHLEQRPAASRPTPVQPRPTSTPAVTSIVEALGKQQLEGFTATGTRRTETFPPGTLGNEQPIVIVSENWFCAELRAVLLSVRDDPRFGHTTTKLMYTQRADPDPTLFQIPPDYTVQEDKA